MLELLQIKEKLEKKGYKDANSLFELRLLLMEAASFLTKKYLSNFKNHKDISSSALLVKTFSKIRHYYYIIETGNQGQAQCFSDIKELVLTDISSLLSSHYTQDYKIIPLQTIAGASLGMAR
jgi:hypothetical protein